jgi:predicted Zn finger-like uncharacterized protein
MSAVTCPHCRTRLTVTPELAEEGEVECPNCQHVFPLDPPQARPASRARRAARRADDERREGEKQQPGCFASLGGCLFLILIVGCLFWGCSKWREGISNDIAAADKLYTEGKKAEAVAKYKDRWFFIPDDKRPEVVRRVVDHEAEAGNHDEARWWVTKGLDANMDVKYQSAAARDIHAQVQRERAEAEAKKQAEAARREAEAAKRKAEAEELRKGLPVTADELRREYAADPKAANAKYQGKTLRVTGVLHEYIAPDPGGVGNEREPILSLQPNVEPWVWCYFAPSRDAEVRGLRPGQRVTVRGRCDGIFVGQIKMTGCSVEP